MNRNSLQKLAQLRIEEAGILLNKKQWSEAYYLSGYSIECALKACIAKQTERYDFPDKKEVMDSYTHDLKVLMRVAGLDKEFEDDMNKNPGLLQNWAIVTRWSEQSRYNTFSKEEAIASYNAITDKNNGVLLWISRYW